MLERIIALFFGIFIYSLLVMIFRKKAYEHDLVKNRVGFVKNISQKQDVLNEELSLPISERIFKPMIKSISNKLSKIPIFNRDNGRYQNKNAKSKNLKKMINQAGLTMSVAEYNAVRIIVICTTALIFTFIPFFWGFRIKQVIYFCIFGGFSAYAILRYYLAAKGTTRKRLMEQQLPDILDLLSVSVEAGLGFEQAINHIINHMEGPLVDEFAVTYREMSMGRTRRDALVLLGERCDIEEIKSFSGALVQAGQMGISIKNVLKSQSSAIRLARKNKIREKALKVPTKILIPMILFIFPVLLIVLLGPALMNIMTTL